VTATPPLTATPPARARPSLDGAPRRETFSARRGRLIDRWPQLRHAGFVVAVALSAVLNINRLSQNGYANIFYSGAVKSMLGSLHNFVFASFDPGGLISVDKPPLALWVQAASAKLFGFSPVSLLLPEALAGVLTVALLYYVIARRLGPVAAFAGALALAVFPSFVAVSRDNGVDPVLILLMALACSAGLRATETGRLRTLAWSGVMVGLAFNTKTLAAWLVIPGIALAYLLCAPASPLRRAGHLLVAGLVMAVVSFAWIAFVDLTPASQRPYVGSSTHNSELGLTFEYNGFGRVGGQVGGPGQVVVRPGGYVPARHHAHRIAAPPASPAAAPPSSPAAALPATPARGPTTGPATQSSHGGSSGREKYPIPFGGRPGPLRLFSLGLGDQAAWMLPFALFGLLGMALLALLDRPPPSRPQPPDAPTPRHRWSVSDRSRLATVVVLGGWFLVEAVLLSASKGIVHPYYAAALAPAAAATAGMGAVAFVELTRGRRRSLGLALSACAIAATVTGQIVLLHREHYMLWFVPVLVAGAVLGMAIMVGLRRLAAPAVAATFLLLLVAPTAYSTSTWLAPVEGTFPAAGPTHDAGAGGYGVNHTGLGINRALLAYVRSHAPGSRWALFTVASETAAPLMLLGLNAGAIGGYSGTDPVLDGAGLARLVARGQARYVLLGGEYSLRGGNRATVAVLRACMQLPPSVWHSPVAYPFGLVLFDCAGRERALAES
jgi:4-amino-4-deoxy-L-arabinose transferase-like glycosyltransferase